MLNSGYLGLKLWQNSFFSLAESHSVRNQFLLLFLLSLVRKLLSFCLCSLFFSLGLFYSLLTYYSVAHSHFFFSFVSLVPYIHLLFRCLFQSILQSMPVCSHFLSVEQSHQETFSPHGLNLSKYLLRFQALGLAAIPIYIPAMKRKFWISYLECDLWHCSYSRRAEILKPRLLAPVYKRIACHSKQLYSCKLQQIVLSSPLGMEVGWDPG